MNVDERDTSPGDDDPGADPRATATLLLIFAIIVGVSRRRTATVATVAWSIFVSRMIGARQRRNAETISRLFAEKTSVGQRVAQIEKHTPTKAYVDALARRVDVLERGRFVKADTGRVVDVADDTGGGACT